ncbi:hypothetical protein WDZ92_50445, partial [Nostoc sp. NIES-2111]
PLYLAYRDVQRSVRLGSQKMSWARPRAGLSVERYDIAQDPFEENNLSEKSHPSLEAEFRRAYAAAHTHYADPHPSLLP